MKKIIGLTVALIAVIAMLGTGTWAYFNDVVTSTGNTITAGKLSLTVGGANALLPISIGSATKMKPGDKGHAGNWTLTNGGNINGDFRFKTLNLVNHENTWTSGGVEDKAGDPGTNSGTDGELGGLLKLAIWVDADTSGTWNTGDYYITSAGAKFAYAGGEAVTYGGIAPDSAYATANSMVPGITDTLLVGNVAGGSGVGIFYVDYYFPKNAGSHFTIDPDNKAQDDDITFDLSFALVQAGE